MIKLKSLIKNTDASFINETIELDAENNLTITDVNDIPDDKWDSISRQMKAKGYDSRGGKDAKRAVSGMIERFSDKGYKLTYVGFPDWIDVIINALKLKSNRPQTAVVSYDPKKVINAAVKHFGTTNNLNVAGYILPTGSLLNLSGGGSIRGQDHAEISGIYHSLNIDLSQKYNDKSESTYNYITDFVRECGAIRIHVGPNSSNIQIGQPIKKAQYKWVEKIISQNNGRVYLDIWDKSMGSDSKSYNDGTSIRRILQDINTFYKTGELGSHSEIQSFREHLK